MKEVFTKCDGSCVDVMSQKESWIFTKFKTSVSRNRRNWVYKISLKQTSPPGLSAVFISVLDKELDMEAVSCLPLLS